MSTTTETPMLKQYREMKAKHPDSVLLFRIGDTYQIFKEDAKIAIEILGTPYHVKNTDEDGDIVYTEFPHHALDTYLPKLVRAGKRVAICEENKQEPIEKVTPNATASEPTTEEPKQEPKPNKTMKTKEIKRKDTIIEGVKHLEEEPFAWLTLRIPKDAKDCGKCAEKGTDRTLTAIMVEPDNNKMVVSNTRILHAYDVECNGAWPKDRNTPFQFYIEPKDIARLAGQEVDVAVWKAEVNGRKTEIATCEVVGTITECDYKGRYPNWQKVMPKSDGWRLNIGDSESEIEHVRKWLKPLIGKTKKEREDRRVVLTAVKGTKVEIEVYEADYAASDELGERLGGNTFIATGTPINARMMFIAELFYYSILPDFDGDILVKDWGIPAKFCGKTRESLLCPRMFDGAYCTESDKVETVGQRREREQEERDRREQEEREQRRKEREESASENDNDEPLPF